MDEKKYVVPEGMLKAASGQGFQTSKILEAALRWLAENPIVPTPEQMNKLRWDTADDDMTATFNERSINLATAWQRLMFLAPESIVPEAVKELLVMPNTTIYAWEKVQSLILEAYRRGALSQNEKK